MSRKMANFALSQECDFTKINFSGSVSPMLEIENVGNFLLTQAKQNGSHAYMRGLFFCIFSSTGFLRPSIKKLQRVQATLLYF